MLINNIKKRRIIIKAVVKTTALIKIAKQTHCSNKRFLLLYLADISHVKHTNEKRRIISSNPKYNYNLQYFYRKCYISILILLVLENTSIHQKQMMQKNILVYNQIVIISLQRLNILDIEQLLQQCSLTMEALNQSAQDCVFVFIGNCQKETVNELSISKVN